MKSKKSLKIVTVDEKTTQAFEDRVNDILYDLAKKGFKVIERDIRIDILRAMFVYETDVLAPENLLDELVLKGERPTCGSCGLCEHFTDKRKKPRCKCFGFRVDDRRPACEEYMRKEEADEEDIQTGQVRRSA